MESTLFHDFFGNVYMILFSRTRGEIEPMRGEIEMNIGNSELRKTQFFLGVGNLLVDGVGLAR